MDAICGLQGRAHILPDGVLLITGRRMLLYHFTSIDPTLPLDENQVTLVQQCVIVSLSLSLSLSLSADPNNWIDQEIALSQSN